MKRYKVIGFFTDLRDYDHPYNVGDVFPRQGVIVSEERIAELSSNKNRQGRPLIKAVEVANTQDSTKENATPGQAENPETKDIPAADEPIATTVSQENNKSDITLDAPEAGSHKYSKEDIEAMKLNQIREIAGKLGFKISSTSKDGAVTEFMEKQG